MSAACNQEGRVLGVMKGRSIRTKLSWALVLLMLCVAVLLVTFIVGLHRYREFTEAMRYGSDEFQKAHQLYRTALDLKATKERIHRYNRGEMLSSSPLSDPLLDLLDLTDLETDSYWYLMSSFDDQLTRQIDEVEERIAEGTPMIFAADHRDRLMSIRSTFDALVQSRRTIPNDPNDFHAMMQRRQDVLLEVTQNHLDATRESIDAYSSLIRKSSRHSLNTALVFAIFAIALTIALAIGFTILVVKPFKILLDGARKVANGERSHRIHLGTGDELDELASVLNKMTAGFQAKMEELRKTNENLDRAVQERTNEAIQNEQLASVGFLAAGVAHEINNPLAAIAWSAESLQSRIPELLADSPQAFAQTSQDLSEADQGSPEQESIGHAFSKNLKTIEDEAFRCKAITEKLLEFSRPGNAARVQTDLTALVADVAQIVGKVNDFRHIPIRIHSDSPAFLSVNPQEIRQVVLNLITNALQSLGPEGKVDVEILANDDATTIRVIDNGCGMAPEVQRNLFEPFFTQRKNGGGTGLGLCISRRIVMQHGGSLQANSQGIGFGSVLEMTLPHIACENEPSSMSHSSGYSTQQETREDRGSVSLLRDSGHGRNDEQIKAA